MDKLWDNIKKWWAAYLLIGYVLSHIFGFDLSNYTQKWFGLVKTAEEWKMQYAKDWEKQEETNKLLQGQINELNRRDRDDEDWNSFVRFCLKTHGKMLGGEATPYVWQGYSLEQTDVRDDGKSLWFKTLNHSKYGAYKVYVYWDYSRNKFIYRDWNGDEKRLKKDEEYEH